MGHLLGYARVSTAEQSADLQVDELTAAGCWRVWTDSASGVLDRRPQLDEVLEQLRPGDTLVVWRLDWAVSRIPDRFSVDHAAAVAGVRESVSASSGVRYPSVECSRWRL